MKNVTSSIMTFRIMLMALILCTIGQTQPLVAQVVLSLTSSGQNGVSGTWTNTSNIPLKIRVTAQGGGGGNGYNFFGGGSELGSTGATLIGEFTIQPCQTVLAIAGGKGGDGVLADFQGGGGGAGSGIINTATANLLLLAAGGTGAANDDAGLGGSAALGGTGFGGSSGRDLSAGGGGFNSAGVGGAGQNGCTASGGGQVSLTGISSGGPKCNVYQGGNGGSGMGGGGGAPDLAGGGGGYTGGAGGNIFYGPYTSASSFNIGTNQVNTNGSNGTTANNGTVVIEVITPNPPVLTAPIVLNNPSVTDVKCNGGSDGKIVALATGGSGIKTYSINPSVGTQSTAGTITGLTAGIYTITAIDQSGCTASKTVTINEPTPLSISTSKTIIKCFGGSDGTLTITVNGGTPNYLYKLGTMQSATGLYTGLLSGVYSYTVIDANNCSQKSTIIIDEAPPISITTSKTDVNCNGGSDGTATISSSGGTPNYSFKLGTTTNTTGLFTGLATGTYAYTVTDANNCSKTGSIFINEPPKIVITQFSPISSTQCVGSTVTYNAAATGVNMTVKWQKNNSDVTLPVPYISSTIATYTTPVLTASDNGATYRAVFQNGCPNDLIATTNGTIIINTPSVGGTLSPAQSQGCGLQTVNLSVSGINGVVTQWERQANCTGNWVSIGSANLTAITTTTPNQTSCYRVKITNGVCLATYSTISTVTVDKPAVGGNVTLQSNQTATSIALCPSQNALLIPKNYVGKVANWQYSFGTSSIWYDLPNTEGQTSLTVNGSSVSGTVFYRVVIITELGICTGQASVAYSSAFRITKKPGCSSPDGSVVNNEVQTKPHLTIQKVYPNPANEYINLEIENVNASGAGEEGFVQIDIMDVTGRQVLKQTVDLKDAMNIINLDISQLSKGIFIVKMTDSNNQKSMVKMVKE